MQNYRPAEQSLNDEYDKIVKFVLENRKNSNAFKGWKPEEIKLCLIRCAENGAAAVCQDPLTGEITGVVTAIKNTTKKHLYITNILITTRHAMRQCIMAYMHLYQGWSLTATRRFKSKRYDNVEKLLERLWNNSLKT